MISNSGAPEEPTIVVNPNNPRHLVAGSNLNFYYYSTNGGVNWFSGRLSSPYGVWGDPCVVVDTNNCYYYFHLSNPSDGHWIDRIVCQKLDALGGAWSPGTYAGLNGTKAQDKEWAVVDPANNKIHVTWTQFDQYESLNPADISIVLYSSSSDGGQSWTAPVRLNEVPGDCVDSDNTVEGAVPAVGPAGEVYVTWAGPRGLLLAKSADGGATWPGTNIFVSDIPGGWDFAIPGIYRCNGLPVTVCDLSAGPYRGTVYINWSDQRNGLDDTDVWLVKSSDGGMTWSPRRRVNDDPPGRHQFFTWMTVDQADGSLYVVFYDRRDYSDNRTDVYLATSMDGGETFVNRKISQSPFTPNAATFFGDYNNISAHNGIVRPIWTRLEGASLSIWTAMINPPPTISGLVLTNSVAHMWLTNLTGYLTNYVERTYDLTSGGAWTDVGLITGVDGAAEWTEPVAGTNAFYRVRCY
ncbi:MAG TPA: sialidase family protein [Verrucomicrobiae bacterium]